jgi:hypothetical protein
MRLNIIFCFLVVPVAGYISSLRVLSLVRVELPFVQVTGRSRRAALRASVTDTDTSPQQPQQFDPEYYTPPDQSTRTDNSQTRVTLTRFLSNAVKDNPEVSFRYLVPQVKTDHSFMGPY